MPKKTMPVRARDLRRDDVIKETGVRIPIEVDARNFFRSYDSPLVADYGVEIGFLVERLVDEKLTVSVVVLETERIDRVIAECVQQYEHKNGDMKRMEITTSEAPSFNGHGAGYLEVRLEGWIR